MWQFTLNLRIIMKLVPLVLPIRHSRLVMSDNLPSIAARAAQCVAIGIVCLLSAFRAWSANCVPPPVGLVAWWPGEGNANYIAGPNNGVLLNGVAFTNGVVGKAFFFDGVDDRVVVSNAASLNFGPGADFSIEAWIKTEAAVTDSGVQDIVDKRLAPDIYRGQGYLLCLVDGQLTGRLSDSMANVGTIYGPAGPDLRNGQFHHVAMTLARNSSTGGKLYVDGQAVVTFDPTGEAGDLTAAAPLRIGNHPTEAFPGFFKGAIDEVSIYNRALSAVEIQAIYQAGSAGKCITVPVITSQPRGQVGYWGKSVAFDVRAVGGPPLYYQWLKDGSPIAGASESSHVLTNFQLMDAGSYSVLVTNAYGSTTSSNAYLTMNPAGVSLALYSGITIDGVVGLTYGIQYSSDLSNTNGWRGMANVTLSVPTELWFDVQPANQPRRCYRVVPGPISVP